MSANPTPPGHPGLAEVARVLVDAERPSTTLDGQRSGRVEDVLHVLLSALGPLFQGSVYFLDRSESRVLYTTEYLLGQLGYSSEEIRSMTLEDLNNRMHPRDRHVLVEGASKLCQLADDGIANVEYRFRDAAGRWRWIQARERVLTRTPDGLPRLTMGTVRNITERQKLKQALTLASKELLTVEEEERRRIAREMHDSTTQLLTGARLLLTQLQGRLEGDLAESAARISRTIGSAQQEIRTLSFLLHPPQLAQHGLPATIEDLARGFARRSGLQVNVEVEGDPRKLAPAIELALFRVAQEGLLNTHKHARASRVDVCLCYEPAAVRLEVEDDGIGIQEDADDLPGRGMGVGLSGMKARMTQLGGRLELLRRERGLLLRASAPTDVSPWRGSTTTG